MAKPAPKRAPRARHADGPSFALEREAMAAGGLLARVIGIDEVGRGPFAGPVVAGAAWLSEAAAEALRAAGLNDSKALTARKREALLDQIIEICETGAANVALGAACVREIEALNIAGATALAMRRAERRLATMSGAEPSLALVDGKHPVRLACPVRMVIGGDRVSLSIAAAAVAAKVVRDRAMTRLHARYPSYDWASNKGYGGSAKHRAAILEDGLTPHHRASFCRNLLSSAS